MQEEPTNPTGEEVEEQPQPQGQAPEPQEQEQPQEETSQEQPGQQLPEETPLEETPPEEETPPAPSRREQLRVQQLLNRYPNLRPPTASPQALSQSGPNFRDRINADEDTLREIEETAIQYGQTQFTTGIQQAEYGTWRRFLQMDENQVRSKYDMFNPSKEESYHKAAEESMRLKYLRFVGFNPGDPQQGIAPSVQNPDVSYADFVDAEMEFSDELAAQRTQRTTQNIAKQAATTGLRPDGSSPRRMDLNRDPSDMSDDELKAAISATMPRDARGRFTSNNR